MKRFPPFLSDSAGVFSLVLCGALVSAWIGSYARDLRIQWSGQGTLKRVDHFSGLGAFSAQALRGKCELQIELNSSYESPGTGWNCSSSRAQGELYLALASWQVMNGYPGVHRIYLNWSGFGCYRDDVPGYSFYRDAVCNPGYGAIFPLWPLVLLTALPAALWMKRRMAGRGFNSGLCVACGYDLRASPGRCPECGQEQIIATDKKSDEHGVHSASAQIRGGSPSPKNST